MPTMPTIHDFPPAASALPAALLNHLRDHRQDLRDLLLEVAETGGLTETRYTRYLSAMLHLTRGVQRHFFAVAGHDDLRQRAGLREFLVTFALEEEPHWRIALADLHALGHEPGEPPIEADLWWAFFDRAVTTRPFVRLGATALLENVGDIVGATQASLMDQPFLRPDTTRFYEVHRHERHPHGEQVVTALVESKPTVENWADMIRGAEVARRLHLGLLRSALLGEASATSVEVSA